VVMAIKMFHAVSATSDTARPVPRWALRAAYLLPLTLLPVGVWRLPFAFGFEMGQVYGPDDRAMPGLWFSIPYVFGLTALSELMAFLYIGLVCRWGEVAPSWIPFIGGKHVRPVAAVIPAAIGSLIMTAVSVSCLLNLLGVMPGIDYDNTGWLVLARACMAPIILFGPLALALTVHYYKRHHHQGGSWTPGVPAHSRQ
jgi:hypothetical protein